MISNDQLIYYDVDINECGDNNGGCSHSCVNMAGTYRCECPTGYALLPNKRDCVRGGKLFIELPKIRSLG